MNNQSITIEFLKANREEIISKIKAKGCEDKLKTFMELIKMEVEFGTRETDIDVIIDEIWHNHFRFAKKQATWMDARERAELKGAWNEDAERRGIYNRKFA